MRGDKIMALATWWRGDALPTLAPVPGFRAEVSWDESLIAYVTGLDPEQVRHRLCEGHVPYLAYIDSDPVGYGWSAQNSAEIGELHLSFALPPSERYLWDFATLPAWQGYGIYPRLLQCILAQQPVTVERVWIIFAPENTPSGTGMHKAGFVSVGQLSFRRDGSVGLVPLGAPERAQAGAGLLGVPLIDQMLAPCWSCGGAQSRSNLDIEPGTGGCWPPVPATMTSCTCAVELKPGKVLPNTLRN
jgi:GNAT superfamily N-acetyltransferase